MRIKNLRNILNWVVLVIPVMQVLLFLVSWLINAALPESQVRSLLGSEGISWFFGSFVDHVATPPLVWILVAAIAYGATRESGILEAIQMKSDERRYRQTFALRIVAIREEFLHQFVLPFLQALHPERHSSQIGDLLFGIP